MSRCSLHYDSLFSTGESWRKTRRERKRRSEREWERTAKKGQHTATAIFLVFWRKNKNEHLYSPKSFETRARFSQWYRRKVIMKPHNAQKLKKKFTFCKSWNHGRLLCREFAAWTPWLIQRYGRATFEVKACVFFFQLWWCFLLFSANQQHNRGEKGTSSLCSLSCLSVYFDYTTIFHALKGIRNPNKVA